MATDSKQKDLVTEETSPQSMSVKTVQMLGSMSYAKLIVILVCSCKLKVTHLYDHTN